LNITIFFKDINFKFSKRNLTIFSIDVSVQRRILNAFPEPKDLFERSYFQYKCQMKKLSTVMTLCQHIAALFLISIYYFKFKYVLKKIKPNYRENCAVFLTDGVSIQTIPGCLFAEFNEIIPCKFADSIHLGKIEKTVLIELLKRYWYSPYFVFKCMLKIGMYAAKIEMYNPRTLISYSEYSFTSSVLTEYCRLKGVEHINIMHGEKVFNIRDTFAQYDRYYVWDEHYINLLCDLRMNKEQFRIALPDILNLNIQNKDEPLYDFTYYLGAEDSHEQTTIRDVLVEIGVPFSRICIRPHPIYSDLSQIKRIFSQFQIENSSQVQLDISLSRTKYAVSLYSTVLYQAYISGKETIINDVTNKSKYEKLKDLKYIMIEKPHRKLSEFLLFDKDAL